MDALELVVLKGFCHEILPLFPQAVDGQLEADSPDKQEPLKIDPPSLPDHLSKSSVTS